MKKTMNINIAGQLFSIDEDAYEILTRYLEHVSARFRTEQGGDETVADIETRIAEIFGGGNEPPTLVSKEMVSDMINTMGAPEDYYDSAPGGSGAPGSVSYTRKSMYDPNSPSARLGKALSEFFRAFGRVMSAILRIFAILFGVVFTVIGFSLLFTFVLVLFFNNAPIFSNLMEPQMTNLHTLLSIVLNSAMVMPVIILTAIVVLVPLAALIYLGIKMIFNIRESSRVASLITFVAWIAAACALGVFLSLQLSVYSNTERYTRRTELSTPPDTLYIVPGKTLSSISYDEHSTVDDFTFYRQSASGKLFGTAVLDFSNSDTTGGWISVELKASSNSNTEAWDNARAIEYGWSFSGDTLRIDEFFALPAGARWNGSMAEVDICLPKGSVIKFAEGMNPASWSNHRYNRDARLFRIAEWDIEEIEE
ncbi:MAG TPA: hypothetical protein VLQ76_06335 [Bacteroidales bacterium]|nr:hypothetical protein [Bacteroidales bacterium]